jgi:hypothetical protein
MQALRPRRAACAATELARLPVDEQPTVVKPKACCALASATATTRSLKLSVGKQTASFLMKRLVAPMRLPRSLCAQQRREADGEVGLKALRDGEQLPVAPDAGRAGGDGLAGEAAADGVEVK